jgi:hypothetical protein
LHMQPSSQARTHAEATSAYTGQQAPVAADHLSAYKVACIGQEMDVDCLYWPGDGCGKIYMLSCHYGNLVSAHTRAHQRKRSIMMPCQMVKMVAQYQRTCTNQLGPHVHCVNESPGGCVRAVQLSI